MIWRIQGLGTRRNPPGAPSVKTGLPFDFGRLRDAVDPLPPAATVGRACCAACGEGHLGRGEVILQGPVNGEDTELESAKAWAMGSNSGDPGE